jgi:hypothetical protein
VGGLTHSWKIQHNVFTKAISLGVLHRMSRSLGFATTILNHRALDIPTFSRFLLNRNSRCLGRSSSLKVVIETIDTAASWP